MDHEEERRAPKDWKEYWTNMKETGRICRWALAQLVTQESKSRFRIMLLGVAITAVFQTIQPWAISFVFNGLESHQSKFVLAGLCVLFVCMLTQRVGDYISAISREKLFGQNYCRLADRVSQSMFQKSVGQHIQQGSLLNPATIDKARWKVMDLESLILSDGVPNFLSLALSYTFLWFISPVAGGIMTVMIAIYIVWMLYLNQRAMLAGIPLDREFRAINRHTFERWEKVERVKVSAKNGNELTHMSAWLGKTMATDCAFWIWYNKHRTIRGAITACGQTAIFCYGVWLVWHETQSIGLLYPLFSWTFRVADNIWQLGYIEHKLNWLMPSVKSLMDALSLEPDVVEKENATMLAIHKPPRVIFDSVSYQYPPNKEKGEEPIPVLSNINFAIEPGEKVAIIGSSGAGKTTVMRLLMRFMDPTQGSITVDGHDLRNIKLASWMQCIGYIPQQAQVFDGTIRYNLLYACPEIQTDQELWGLMKQVKLDWKSKLSEGLETLVGKNGLKLSGGQAQRLMIGAAVAKKPAFMIIDEATSSLDSTTEKAVQRGLANVLRGNVSALVVAHRLSTVRHMCSRFVVLRQASDLHNGDSQIEAIGNSFEELYGSSPTFRKLAEDQGIAIH
ncbi:MAG: ABC transporter ATP-binding protein [Candidatus Ryanbacteria bacterium]|nr:ABC transporter ATP-binding protein [Candidatus Ryanbacteria bacterium]